MLEQVLRSLVGARDDRGRASALDADRRGWSRAPRAGVRPRRRRAAPAGMCSPARSMSGLVVTAFRMLTAGDDHDPGRAAGGGSLTGVIVVRVPGALGVHHRRPPAERRRRPTATSPP